jgi:hypothetical protein
MTTVLTAVLAALLCGSLAGCALGPVIAANLAAQGATGLVAISLGPMAALQERSEKDRCAVHNRNGIGITESLEAVIPTNEGAVRAFEPAWWRQEFAREGYPEIERARTQTEGTLAITDRAVFLVPLPGAIRVRIPYELVQDVEVGTNAATGAARAVIVKSCYGRFDIVTLAERQPGAPDSAAVSAAAAELNARVAAFRVAAD